MVANLKPVDPSRVTVVMPCLNEAESLPGVIALLPDGYQALVVDNNSTDGTAEWHDGAGQRSSRSRCRATARR